jgi:hypothetical protein
MATKVLSFRLIGAALAVVVMSFAPANAFAASKAEIKKIIIEEAMNSSIPPALALAVAKVESDFEDDALSTAGARGVMQIMPLTAIEEYGIKPRELWSPRLNIQLGIDYLDRLHVMYGNRWDLALSHYNGGSLNGKGGDAIPHSYTRKYVASVMKFKEIFEDQSNVWSIYADTNVKDGWKPARTRVAALDDGDFPRIRNRPASRIEDRFARKVLELNRKIRKLARARHIKEDYSGWKSDENFSSLSFQERLDHARRTLDDFTS